MPIVGSQPQLLVEGSNVSLALYAAIIQVNPENLFWGVRRADDSQYDCRTYWIKAERDNISRMLAEAQIEIEQETRYPLVRRWIANEQRPWSWPLSSDWNWAFDGGVRATDGIDLDAAVTHVADDVDGNPSPSTVTVATAITDVNEIKVYYPASLGVEGPVEIDPSDIDADGVNAVISIPRCRLVRPGLVNNPRTGLEYDVEPNFLSLVDVVRVYHDESTQATLVWPHRNSSCSCGAFGCPVCGEFTRTGCIYVKVPEIGSMDVLPATFSSGSWTVNLACLCSNPHHVILNYRAGLATLSPQARDAVIRLAHAKMPDEPCGCQISTRMWKRDRNVSLAQTRERINCRFGLSDGAWAAWEFSQALKVKRSFVF